MTVENLSLLLHWCQKGVLFINIVKIYSHQSVCVVLVFLKQQITKLTILGQKTQAQTNLLQQGLLSTVKNPSLPLHWCQRGVLLIIIIQIQVAKKLTKN